MDAESSGRRTRSASKAEEKRKKVSKMTDVGHFGTDVSAFVDKAMQSGGSLDETSRATMRGKIRGDAARGSSLREVVPSFVADHVELHQKSVDPVFQQDLRVQPRKSSSYVGHQLTSTRVDATHGSEPDSKTIGEPLSPAPPSDFSGSQHRAHAAPFGLIGEPSNRAQTVWAPSWANVTVDSHIEKKALSASRKGHSVFHFRLDTDTHSTVGMVKQRSGSSKPAFKAISATYKRR